MGELILHIGTTKTGTSSLQGFFSANREMLAEYGVEYPSFTEQPWPGTKKNGIFLNKYSLTLARKANPRSTVNDIEENLLTLSASLSSSRRSLISDENMFLSSAQLLDSPHSPERFWTSLANTLVDAGMQRAVIVVYLRRQDDWVASAWRQRVKGAGENVPLEEFCAKSSVRLPMDYAHMLSMIESAFRGYAHIVVRRYDRNRFESGSIYRDFCAAASIPWDDRFLTPETEANPSISFDVAEALRVFKEVAPSRTPLRNKVLRPLAYELSRQNPDAPGTTPFDEGTTRALLEPFLIGNKQVSDRYLDGEPLFSEEYGGRSVWAPNEERIAEYRTAFKEAIGQPGPYSHRKNMACALARALPEGVKRPLRAARKGLFSR